MVGESKIKIVLSEEERQSYSLDTSAPDISGPSARRSFWSILDMAKREVGFDPAGDKVLIQLYPIKNGGCEIFVTKSALIEPITKKARIDEDSLAQSDMRVEKHATKREAITKHKEKDCASSLLPEPAPKPPSNQVKRSGRLAFSFECIDMLVSVCNILYQLGITPKSRVFRDSDEWYLLLSDTDTSAFARLDKLTFILEYGKRENPDCLLTYVTEHGKIICRDKAIETLAPLKV